MTDDAHTLVQQRIADHQAAIAALAEQSADIAAIGERLVATLRADSRVLLCGNGGSAGDAQHIATEITCRFETHRPGLPAIALTTDSSALTAISNDFGFERVFARQVEAIGRAGDALIAISTSGTSPNITAAVLAARAAGVLTIGLTGRDGGDLARECDACLVVPSQVTAHIQEAHILIGHIWCAQIDKAFTA